MPELADVEVEWTGYRAGVSAWAPRLGIGEKEQYEKMMEDVEEGSPVVLYFHGGAFWLVSPVYIVIYLFFPSGNISEANTVAQLNGSLNTP